MESSGDKLSVRHMKPQDVVQMCEWGEHSDIRFQAYNFPYTRALDLFLWYKSKKKIFLKYIFGVFLEEKMIGYITLKQINWWKREAFMGVAFDPNYLSQGYGTKAIKLYLKLVREQYGMRGIHLKTSVFNIRGQRCYQKAGFNEYMRAFEPFEDQSQSFELLLKCGDFQMVGDEIFTEYLYMYCDLTKVDQ